MRVSYECDSKAGFLYGFMHGCTIYYFPYILLKALDGGEDHIKLIAAAPFVGTTLTLFWSNYYQNLRKLPLVVWSKTLARLCLLIFPFITGAWGFAAMVVLFWTLESMAAPAYSGIMKEIYLDTHRGLAMGYVRMQVCFGQVLGALLSAFILHTPGANGNGSFWDHVPSLFTPGPDNYTWLFPIGVAAGTLGLIFFHRLGRWSDQSDFTDRRPEKHMVRQILHLLRERPALLYTQITLFAVGTTNLMCVAVYPVFQVRVLNIQYEQAALLSAVQAICGIASYFIFGSMVDRRNLLAWHAWTFGMFVLGSALYLVTRDFTGVVFATLAMGMGSGGWDLVRSNLLIRMAPRHHPQPVFVLDLFTMGLRGIAAPFLGLGLLAWSGSYRLVFGLNIVVGLVGMAVFLWLGRHYHEGRPVVEGAPRPRRRTRP